MFELIYIKINTKKKFVCRQIYFFIHQQREKLFNNLLKIYMYTFINSLLLDANLAFNLRQSELVCMIFKIQINI